jgi:hypothetical protein
MQSKTSTQSGDVTHTLDIQQDEAGQTVVKVSSALGAFIHQHSITVGAEDGHDAVTALSDDELAASLQQEVDNARQNAATILSGRARVAKIITSLK